MIKVLNIKSSGKKPQYSGRAEFEEISKSEIFEKKPASEIYAFPAEYLTDDFNIYGKRSIGMIIGGRGCGKTFFGKKLHEEIGGKIYYLDKDRFVYEVLEEAEKPKFILVDDLHYYIQSMRLRRKYAQKVPGYKGIKEDVILKKICSFKEEAEKKNIPLIFVSDEGPAGLYFAFEKEENRKKFADILKDCACSGDDVGVIRNLIGHETHIGRNILKFRSKIKESEFEMFKKELNIQDVPFAFSQSLLVDQLASPSRYEGWYCRKNENFIKYFNEYGLLILDNTWKEEILNAYARTSIDGTFPRQLLCPLREFKVVSDRLGSVNRKLLNISFGSREDVDMPNRSGWVYNISELKLYQHLIHEKYKDISERGEFLNLAKAIFYSKNDDEAIEYMLAASLEKEHP